MKSANFQSNFSLSMMISLLLHLLVFFLVNLYVQLHPDKPKRTTSMLNVRLVTANPPLPRTLPAKKLLTIPTPSPVKVTQIPIQPPTPTDMPDSQGEQITGIAMPRSIASPFSSSNAEGNDFFRAHHTQQNAMRAYQEYVIAQQAQQTEQHARSLLMQLKNILEKSIAENPVIEGKCILNLAFQNFECDSVALKQKILKIEPITVGIFNSLRVIGTGHYGFVFNNQTTNPSVVIINERPQPQ